jgi:antitoxin ParD1/3/4
MNITLSPELESMIREKVEAGEYHDASEVISQAMRALAKYENALRYKQMLEVALAEAAASLDRGEGVELTDELWDQLMAEGDARAARGEPIDPLITGEY